MSNRISRYIENRLDEIEQAYEQTKDEAVKKALHHKRNRLNKIRKRYRKINKEFDSGR